LVTEETEPKFKYSDDRNYILVTVGVLSGFFIGVYGASKEYSTLVTMSTAFIVGILGHLYFIRNKHKDSYREMRNYIREVDEKTALPEPKLEDIKSAFGVEE
jgi:hypothetical protein